MKILYAIQGTGNGHISRAIELIPYLKDYGHVDFLFSGRSSTIEFPTEIKYRFNGLNLFYNNEGGLSYFDIFKNNSLTRTYKLIKELPVEHYDLVINDFEFITSMACKLKKIPTIHFGHQASFQSKNVPLPLKRNYFQEYILKHFAESKKYVGLHFKSYDEHIVPPIIKKAIINVESETLGHYTIYLPSVNYKILLPHLLKLKKHRFHLFTNDFFKSKTEANVTLYAIDSDWFTKSMMQSNGVITGGGFETPAEALYLEKKLMSIPIKNHYEQQCNAAALQKLGVKILEKIDDDFYSVIHQWIDEDNKIEKIEANDISKTLEKVIKEGLINDY